MGCFRLFLGGQLTPFCQSCVCGGSKQFSQPDMKRNLKINFEKWFYFLVYLAKKVSCPPGLCFFVEFEVKTFFVGPSLHRLGI